MSTSFLSPAVRVGGSAIRGNGAMSAAPIRAGEVVAAFGGRCMSAEEFAVLPTSSQTRSVQIAERLFLVAADHPEPGNTVNHSCEPNCRLSGQLLILADRDIAVGEELTFDYATCAGSDYGDFECRCGASSCLQKVTGHDWMLPELQLRLRGSFSPYLARRIVEFTAPVASRRVFGL